MRLDAVEVGLPPVHSGDATITRNEPSEFGVNVTFTWVELTTDAVTFWPPAVIAAIAPNVCPELPVWELSTQVWARLPIAPDAAADGDRPLHKFSVAVCCVLGLAPVTFTTSSSLPAGTHACMLIPPPVSSSTPSYRSSVPLKFDADVIVDRPGMFNCPGDSRYGIVSLRFSCAVNPFAAHAATPSEPLPSGRDWLDAVFASPSTTSDSATTPAGFSENEPFCQAVVAVAATAGGASTATAASGTPSASPVAIARRRDNLRR